MKTLKFVLYVSLLLTAVTAPLSEAFAQKKALPPGLNEGSTVKEIIEYLNRTSFPYARIGLRVAVTSSLELWDPSVNSGYPVGSLVFSPRFRLVSGADDCHLLLRNEDVTVYDVWGKDVRPISLRELTESLPPYTAEFSTWLETASHKGGKAPFLYTRNPERAKLLGAWRTEFKSRGFFVRSIFGVKIPALKRGLIGREQFETNDTVGFMFDDRQAAERFDAAFRRLIKLCQPRSTKPRWTANKGTRPRRVRNGNKIAYWNRAILEWTPSHALAADALKLT